ncbi:MAG: hypothetical protein JW931_06195 [Methanomicrobiaceae archaeon]|nr:hypothetical protein [Methanomicrobiaceae archaeon]
MKIFFGKEEKFAIMLLLIVILFSFVLLLVLDSAGKESFASPYSPSSEEGDLVTFGGPVDEIVFTKTGGHIIVKSGKTSIFIRNAASQDIIPDPGMMIHATGTVENYKGEMEIYVSDPADAIFINKTSQE